MLKSHSDNLAGFFAIDPRAKLLVEYYLKAGPGLKEDMLKIQEESRQLYGKTQLMQEIIQTMQQYAYGNQNAAYKEEADIAELIETALKIQESNIRKYKIKVNRVFASLGPILTQKNKLAHVLINLIKNATEAMEKNADSERVLTIKLRGDHKEKIIVEIADTGEGVSEENLKKIFTYGFTTKKNGHGFGLHACVNYMTEMGGDITVTSKGPGKGAVFTLVVPVLKSEKN